MNKLYIICNDIVLDFGGSVFPVICSNNKVLHCAYYVLCTLLRPFKGTVRLKMDGDKLISTKIEEIPEYPFIVESEMGVLYFVSAATDGKCSPAIDESTRFITRNFKESGLGDYKVYNRTVILKNRKGE